MPTATEEDWAVDRPPDRPACPRPTAATGRRSRRRCAATCWSPRARCARSSSSSTSGWPGPYFTSFVASGPEALQPELLAAAAAADAAVAEIRDHLRDEYGPRTEGVPDAVGRDRYAMAVRRWTGSDLGPDQGLEEAYAWGWAEHKRILAEQRIEADRVQAGATPMEAMRVLATSGPAVEGVEEIRVRLQSMMDEAIAELDGTHFDLAEPLRRVEAMIAPARQRGGAVLHAALAGLLPARPHLAADAGPDPLPALGPGVDLVPRGRPGPPPAAGPVGARLAAAVDLPDLGGLGQRQRRGLGALRRAVHGRARLLRRPRHPAGLPRRPAAALGAGGHRHRHAPGAADPRRRRGRAGRAPRAAVDPGPGAGVPRRELRRLARLPRQRAGPLPRHPGAGDRLQARRAGMAGRAREGPAGARRRVRPQGVAHGRAVTGVARPGRPGGRARARSRPLVPSACAGVRVEGVGRERGRVPRRGRHGLQHRACRAARRCRRPTRPRRCWSGRCR